MTTDHFPNDQGRKLTIYFGSTVSARSVRLSGTDRDKAYDDIRQEVINSTLALNCTHVLGYRETISVVLDVILFSAYGTAVKIRLPKDPQSSLNID